MRYLVTGVAGFIGFHVAKALLDEGHEVFGIDNFTPYYSVKLKERRVTELAKYRLFRIEDFNLAREREPLSQYLYGCNIDRIIHLAAQAGVRHSFTRPDDYMQSNVMGTYNLLEISKRLPNVQHIMVASTSSVYGQSDDEELSERAPTDHPISLYAASKKACEALAYYHSHHTMIPTTVFRFFSVYGPWGRPDMALWKFVEATIEGKPIDVYNDGNMYRDWTYIDDLVKCIIALSYVRPLTPTGIAPEFARAPYRVVNIGPGQPIWLNDFIREIEQQLGIMVTRNNLPMQPGDVQKTRASTDYLFELIGYKPNTPMSEGIGKFIDWYKEYKTSYAP